MITLLDSDSTCLSLKIQPAIKEKKKNGGSPP